MRAVICRAWGAVDDLTLAGQILRRKNFRLFGEGDLPGRAQGGH